MKNALSAAPLLFAALLLGGAAAEEEAASVPTDLERVHEGVVAPDFSLSSGTGERRRLSDYRKSKNVVLIFYRGYW